jgi:hypothetical protein
LASPSFVLTDLLFLASPVSPSPSFMGSPVSWLLVSSGAAEEVEEVRTLSS